MHNKYLKILIVIVLISVACYYSFNIIMNMIVHTEKEVIIPDVKGKSVAEAVSHFSSIGLGVIKEGEEINQNVSPGVVLRQNPPAGMSVRKGKTIKITTSQGGETIYIPDLVDKSVRNADIVLKSSNLMLGEVSSKYSVTAEKGIVLSQEPEAGSSADNGTIVNVVVSDGPPPDGMRLMPNFENQNIAKAREWGAREKVKIDIKKEKSAELEEGTIIRQTPEPDTDISSAKRVTLYVSEK